MLSRPSTRPSDDRGRQSSAFVRESSHNGADFNVCFPPIADSLPGRDNAFMSNPRTFLLATILLLALFGCASSQVDVPPPPDWRSVVLVRDSALPTVTVTLPQGYSVTTGHGIDSAVAQIRGPGTIINADYGRAGMQLCGTIRNCRQFSTTVDGRPATWVRFPKQVTLDNQIYSQRLDFAVKLWPSQDPRVGPTQGLLLVAACATSAHCDVAQKIARSVKFDQPPR